ncbi:MAG: 3-oxoacyl-[acyl-carrier protein] reductase [Clostridiales bacterium]|jgi:NAD(P)-dependent dehydrogenase (short-subunit alcohol dehydrogenase family)|nr:3-oxoacyl-[acyl-carrier protein] reductase [Clostridiales bacterium]MDK2934837.1 3-oxoacyl-[acyl-carrier protein] reductase [Clostridiales bacterium]
MSFEGKVAIVTGAGSKRGIGKAIALCLAQKGADIVVADMNLEGAKEVAKEIEGLGRKAIAVEVNVTKESDVQQMVETTLKEFGKVDILVNNAGITQPVKTIDTTEADWDRIIAVNLKGTFLCSKAVLKPMMEQKYGRIVNISSVSGKRGGGVYGGSHYSAAKAGILGFAKALAREVVEYGITVNSVAPGLVDTDIRAGLPMEKERAIWETIPMKRPGSAMEIAETVAFLASDAASYITGEDIDVNGGSHMD